MLKYVKEMKNLSVIADCVWIEIQSYGPLLSIAIALLFEMAAYIRRET